MSRSPLIELAAPLITQLTEALHFAAVAIDVVVAVMQHLMHQSETGESVVVVFGTSPTLPVLVCYIVYEEIAT